MTYSDRNKFAKVVHSTSEMSARRRRSGSNVLLSGASYKPKTLSSVFRKSPSFFDAAKISVVEKYVTEVDLLPPNFRNAETVFLSHNSISSLSGLRQFQNVRVLSIANNCISSLEELHHLRDLRRLQVLNLEMNPVTQLPNYRAHVITTLPGVRTLDGKDVSANERQQAGIVTKKEAAMLSLMTHNLLLFRKLDMALKKLRVHMELRGVVFGRVAILNRNVFPTYTAFDTRKCIALWDIENWIDDSELTAIHDHLRDEVRRMFNLATYTLTADGHTSRKVPVKDSVEKSKRGKWDAAFSEVMLRQQNVIANAVSHLEEARQLNDEAQLKLLDFDPLYQISQLREEDERGHAEALLRQESVIRDFRATINKLLTDFRRDFNNQALDYETKVSALQSKIDQLTLHSPDNTTVVESQPFRMDSEVQRMAPLDTSVLSTSMDMSRPFAPPSTTTKPLPKRPASHVSGEGPVSHTGGAHSQSRAKSSAHHNPQRQLFESEVAASGLEPRPSGSGTLHLHDTPGSGGGTTRPRTQGRESDDVDTSPMPRARRATEGRAGSMSLPQPSPRPQPPSQTPHVRTPSTRDPCSMPDPTSSPRQSRPTVSTVTVNKGGNVVSSPRLLHSRLSQESGDLAAPSNASILSSVMDDVDRRRIQYGVETGKLPVAETAERPRSGNTLGYTGVEVPRDIQEHLNFLQIQLEERAQSEARLSQLNQQLQEKLREFQDSNVANLARAQDSLRLAAEEKERECERLREEIRMAQDAIADKEKSQHERESKFEAFARNKEVSLREARKRVEELEHQVTVQSSTMKGLRDTVDGLAARERALERERTDVWEQFENLVEQANCQYEAWLLRRAFDAWEVALPLLRQDRKHRRLALTFYRGNLLSAVMHNWHFVQQITKQCKRIQLRPFMERWAEFTEISKFSRRFIRKRYWRRWRNYVVSWRDVGQYVHHRAGETAYEHWYFRVLLKCIAQWRDVLRRAQSVKRREQFVLRLMLRAALHRHLAQWRYNTRIERMRRIRSESFMACRNRRTLEHCIFGWRYAVDLKQRRRRAMARAEKKYLSLMCTLPLTEWAAYTRWRIEKARMVKVAIRSYHMLWLKKYYAAWGNYTRCRVEKHRNNARAMSFWRFRTQQRYFLAWRTVFRNTLKSRRNKETAFLYRVRRLRTCAWNSLKKFVVHRQKKQFVVGVIEWRAKVRRRMYARDVFCAFRREVTDRLRAKNNDFKDNLRLAVARSHHDLQRLASSEKLGEDTSARLNELQRKLSDVQKELSRRDSQLAHSEKEHAQSRERIEALEEQLVRSKEGEAECIEEIHRLQALLEDRHNVEADAIAFATVRKKDAEEQVRSLQTQLQEDREHRKVLEEKVRALQKELGMVQTDAEGKLSAAFDIASSLRLLLEDRESELASVRERSDTQAQKMQALEHREKIRRSATAQISVTSPGDTLPRPHSSFNLANSRPFSTGFQDQNLHHSVASIVSGDHLEHLRSSTQKHGASLAADLERFERSSRMEASVPSPRPLKDINGRPLPHLERIGPSASTENDLDVTIRRLKSQLDPSTAADKPGASAGNVLSPGMRVSTLGSVAAEAAEVLRSDSENQLKTLHDQVATLQSRIMSRISDDDPMFAA
eukprot:Rmarinus@m.13890